VLSGAGHKKKFSPLAAELGVLDVDACKFHVWVSREAKSKASDRNVRPTHERKKAALGGPLSVIRSNISISIRKGNCAMICNYLLRLFCWG
jgi:hypothetical protein